MTPFLVIGIVGLVVLLVALVFGDAIDGLVDGLDLGDGLFSLPVLAGFVAAFGFGGVIADGATGGSFVAALVAGTLAGVLVAWLTLRLTRAAMRMRTDEPFRVADLAGRAGKVVTRITPGRFGEVVVAHAGQSHKLAAQARGPFALDAGTEIVVIEALSPTSVVVESAADFWSTRRVGDGDGEER